MITTTHRRWRGCAALLVALLTVVACGRGVTVIETTPKQTIGDGTVTGIVTGPDGKTPLPDRVVEAQNVATSGQVTARTNAAGGYTLKLAPGTYRISVRLSPGETLAKQPPPMAIDVGEIETRVDFTVNGAPRRPS